MQRLFLLSLALLSLVRLSSAATLYVDKDQGCPGSGTTGTPYCSLQNAFDVVNPGDIIRIRDSATPYSGTSTLTRSGTNGNPITIEADPGHTPNFICTTDKANTGAIALGVDGSQGTGGVHDVIVQNLTFDGTGQATMCKNALKMTGWNDATRIQILTNTFKNWGGNAATAGVSTSETATLYLNGHYCNPTACAASTTPTNITVRGNTFDGNRGRNLQLLHVSDSVIEQNTFVNNRCIKDSDGAVNTLGIHILDGFHNDAIYSSGLVIRNNVFHDFQSKPSCDIANTGAFDTLAAIWCDGGTGNSEVSGNTIYNIDQGRTSGYTGSTDESVGIFIEAYCHGWKVFNNVVRDVGIAGIRNRSQDFSSSPSTWTQPSNSYYNNTIVNIYEGIQSAEGDIIVKNNIVSNASWAAIHFDPGSTGSDQVINNNLYYDPSGTKIGAWGSFSQGSSFATWKTACGCDANSVSANPLFTNAGANDFTLQSGSPARNAGTDLASVGVTTDFLGVARPQPPGGAYDMGAYEFVLTSSPPTATITAPTSGTTFSTNTTPLTTLAGTAADDVGVTSVTWACPTCTPTSGTATCATCGASATAPSWSVASLGLASGDNVITVTANDADTQTGTDTLTVTYTPLTAAPTILRLVK